MLESYRYYAFISYASQNRKTATRLQKRLESYGLPRVIRQELKEKTGEEYPKRLKPIFMDTSDLPPGPLGKSILRELEDSKYLIVLCTPESAQKEWVNRETENFIAMGRADRIIPFVVDGKPNAKNPNEEAFPPVLRTPPVLPEYENQSGEERELIRKNLSWLNDPSQALKAVTFVQEGMKIALLKIVAKLLDLRPDVVIQRDRQRTRKYVAIWTTAVLVFLTSVASFSWHIYDAYYRTHVGYYVDYVEEFGVPKGLFPLSKEQVARKHHHWRIETKAGLVRRLVHANSNGLPISKDNIEIQERPVVAEYSYDEATHKLLGCVHLSKNGRNLLTFHYSGKDNTQVEIKKFGKNEEEKSFGLGTNSWTDPTAPNYDLHNLTSRSKVQCYKYEHDSKGRVVRQYFRDSVFKPVKDPNGIAGYEFELDDNGRVHNKFNLDLAGKRNESKFGVARKEYEYDPQGNIVKVSYYSLDDTLVFNELGWKRCVAKFDANGNCIEEKSLDENGDLLCMDQGYARITYQYDDRGNKIELAFFDVDNNPGSFGDRFVILRSKFDDRGNQIEETFGDVDGKPCLCNDGYAKTIWKYDDRGNAIEKAFLDLDNKLCLLKERFAKFTQRYDEQGNLVEEAYFGNDDKPCTIVDGYSKEIWKYDDQGNAIEQAYFDVDGKLCLHNDGYAKIQFQYNEFGYATEEAYFDVDGTPCSIIDGYAKMTIQYDERGNITEQACFDVDNKPCLHKDGRFKISSRYDEQGNKTEETYYGIDGKPSLCQNGYAKIKWQYDERGNRIEQAYFDVDGKPGLFRGENAKISWKYDDQGNQIEQAYFDVDGKPYLIPDGYAKITWKYANRRRQVEEAYYNVEDVPCANINGIAAKRAKYDEQGNLTETGFFDVEGNQLVIPLVKITSAQPNFPFARSELRHGDIILSYDDKIIENFEEFYKFLNEEKKETRPITLLIVRDGGILTIDFKQGEFTYDLTPYWISQDKIKTWVKQ